MVSNCSKFHIMFLQKVATQLQVYVIYFKDLNNIQGVFTTIIIYNWSLCHASIRIHFHSFKKLLYRHAFRNPSNIPFKSE